MTRSSSLIWGVVLVALCAIALSIATSGDIEFDLDESLPVWSNNKTVVVTGANAGLGLATVLRIAHAGTAKNIVLACRNVEKCQRAVEEVQEALPANSATRVHRVIVDLASRDSIVQGARSLQELLSNDNQKPAVDVLINNAGVAYAWNTKEFVEGVETHMAINYLGHVLWTHCLWPNLLLAGEDGTTLPRVVLLSSLTANGSWRDASIGWKDPNPTDNKWYNLLDCIGFYGQSKRANLMFAWELHKRYGHVIDSVAAHPGYARSEIFWNMRNDFFTQWIRELLANFDLISMSSHDGASMQLMAAFAPQNVVPSGSYVVPKYWTKGSSILIPSLLTRFSLHYKSFTDKDSASLWDASMKELGINEFGQVYLEKIRSKVSTDDLERGSSTSDSNQ